jgi:hypothetical protein
MAVESRPLPKPSSEPQGRFPARPAHHQSDAFVMTGGVPPSRLYRRVRHPTRQCGHAPDNRLKTS